MKIFLINLIADKEAPSPGDEGEDVRVRTEGGGWGIGGDCLIKL